MIHLKINESLCLQARNMHVVMILVAFKTIIQ